MNEVFKKIIYCIFGVVLLLLLGGACIQTYRLEQTRQQLEFYRVELESAQNREQLLTNTIDDCFNRTRKTGEVLSCTISSFQDLRKQLQEVRSNYEQMENRLLDFYDTYTNRNNRNYYTGK